jgi:hypothetical protein
MPARSVRVGHLWWQVRLCYKLCATRMCNFVCCQIIWSRVWCFARRAGGALCTCDQLVGKGADTPIQTSPPSSDLLALDLPVFSLALVAGGPLLSSCAHRTTGLVFFILLDLCLSCCITKKKTGKMSKRIRRCPIILEDWVLAQCDSRNAQHLHSDCWTSLWRLIG